MARWYAVLGAIIGSGLLKIIVPTGSHSMLGGNSLPLDMSSGNGLLGAVLVAPRRPVEI